MNQVQVAIFGVRGYSGLETARLVLQHPKLRLTHAFATEAAGLLSQLLLTQGAEQVSIQPQATWLEVFKTSSFDVAFLATPAEVSIRLAPELLEKGVKVIDLSGGFRLPAATFEKWYGHAHESQAWIEKAVYGLVPFAMQATSISARTSPVLIANPGCYATSILMALIPLFRAGVIEANSIVIDAKSGTTGAGKKAAEHLLFSEVDGECRPYRVGRHQHLPEIVQGLKLFAGVEASPVMTTHLLPVKRGILSSIYLKFAPRAMGLSREAKLELVSRAYADAYADVSLVQFGALAEKPLLSSLSAVVGSARTQLSFEAEGDDLYVFSVIDNLLKGAASQAVENLNLVHGWSSGIGLETGFDAARQ